MTAITPKLQHQRPGLHWAQAGTLDPTFANHGIFKTNFANCCGGVSAVALQSDGKILVWGEVTPSRTVGSITGTAAEYQTSE